MSFMDDCDPEHDEELLAYQREEAFQSYLWITNEGKKVPVWELEDSHIDNILKMFPDAEAVKAWRDFKND